MRRLLQHPIINLDHINELAYRGFKCGDKFSEREITGVLIDILNCGMSRSVQKYCTLISQSVHRITSYVLSMNYIYIV